MLFRDYLSGRSQRVVLDGEISEGVNVTSRVPQGSILGPLMFNIFMNSISLVLLSPNCYLIIYADDILLFKPIDESDLNDIYPQGPASDFRLDSSSRSPSQPYQNSVSAYLPLQKSTNTKPYSEWLYYSFNYLCQISWSLYFPQSHLVSPYQ